MEPELAACRECGLVHALPPLAPGRFARCVRCGGRVADARGGASNARAAHAVAAALILYPLAISLPVLRLERLGEASESSVLGGSLGLLRAGDLELGLVVFLCSIVVPLAKLGTLALLLRRPHTLSRRARHHAWRVLELAGRFGMLDVLLVSVLVAWLELGAWVEVTPGPGAAAFGACVACSLLASAWFDPHALWARAPAPGAAV
jgi:paraquat-inducible protein A